MAYQYPKADECFITEDLADVIDISDCETVEELAMRNALLSADDFLAGKQDWFLDDVLGIAARAGTFDYDEAWLMTRVLFEPAVYYKLTGKVK